MHHLGRPTHLAAIRLAEALVAEADPERRQRGAQLEKKILADAGVARCSRPG